MDHLINHKYTVLEIDRLRKAVIIKMFPRGGYTKNDLEIAEIQLRTYMLNGTRPEELEEFR